MLHWGNFKVSMAALSVPYAQVLSTEEIIADKA
jgi:hypothetical protein